MLLPWRSAEIVRKAAGTLKILYPALVAQLALGPGAVK